MIGIKQVDEVQVNEQIEVNLQGKLAFYTVLRIENVSIPYRGVVGKRFIFSEGDRELYDSVEVPFKPAINL